MARYKIFEYCRACRICVGPECIYENEVFHVGPYKICGSCYRWLNAKGYIDPDSAHRGTEFIRLYPDGTIKRMKCVLRRESLEIIHIPLEQPVPAGVCLYKDSEEE